MDRLNSEMRDIAVGIDFRSACWDQSLRCCASTRLCRSCRHSCDESNHRNGWCRGPSLKVRLGDCFDAVANAGVLDALALLRRGF